MSTTFIYLNETSFVRLHVNRYEKPPLLKSPMLKILNICTLIHNVVNDIIIILHDHCFFIYKIYLIF